VAGIPSTGGWVWEAIDLDWAYALRIDDVFFFFFSFQKREGWPKLARTDGRQFRPTLQQLERVIIKPDE